MKFSRSIQFNAVPDWSSHYISYSNLKKLIYALERASHQAPGGVVADAEASALLTDSSAEPEQVFERALDGELRKVCAFYETKEAEVYDEVRLLLHDEENYLLHRDADGNETDYTDGPGSRSGSTAATAAGSGRMRAGSVFKRFGFKRPKWAGARDILIEEEGDDSDDGDFEAEAEADADGPLALSRSANGRSRSSTWGSAANSSGEPRNSRDLGPAGKHRRSSQALDDFSEHALSVLYDSGITLKRRTISLYVSLCELRSFIQLNRTGFAKALKKFDKTLDRQLKPAYMDASLAAAYPFRPETMDRLSEHIGRLEQAYAEVVTKADLAEARRELRLHLREHVVWERNTVWREMIGIERKAQAASMGIRQAILLRDDDPSKARRQGDAADDDGAPLRAIRTPCGPLYLPRVLFSANLLALLAIVVVFLALLHTPFLAEPEQQNCLAMLVFVSLLWATEVIPLFVTSLLIPFLVVVLRLVRDERRPHARLEAGAAARFIFAAMWTPVIMLLLGGFAIAAALSKYDIAKLLATFVLSKAGTRPRTVLLTNMLVAMLASMWISNVAAPVLCLSIVAPMLRNLPADSAFSKALILGIALAANVGGMASPIASPQNIIALQNMKPQPSWGLWFFVALPVCLVSVLLIWLLLLATFRPGRGTTIVAIRPMKGRFTGLQWFISLVTLATILLWCVSHQLEAVFGDMGVVAVIPLVLFFGTGILTKEDFNNFLWTIIVLAAGGLALGKAVDSSGLLHTIAAAITERVQAFSLYGVLLVFASLILVVATFISHTVAALIILPLVHQVGASMDQPHPNLLVMAGALICSAAMGLPVSGFPNMTAIMMEDSQTGQRYLRVRHFISRGIPSSIMTLLVVVTLGFALMRLVGM